SDCLSRIRKRTWFYAFTCTESKPWQSIPVGPDFGIKHSECQRPEWLTPLPIYIFRKDITVFDALPRLSHHLCNRVTPPLIVGSLFMSRGSLRGFVDLNEDEFGGIISLLDD